MSIPILLIPGLNATPRVFAQQMETLWLFGPVTIADQRRDDSTETMANRILADAPPTFVMLGFSMGGYIAFEIMRRAPERVRGLILLDTQARPDTAEATANRRRGMALAAAGKIEAAAAGTFHNAVHPANVDNAAIRAIHEAMARVNGAEAYRRQQEAIIARPDSGPDLAKIKVPTLIIVGDTDRITPPDAAREMHEAIAGSELVVIEGAGHLSPIEQPEQVNRAIGTWLGKLVGR